MGQPSDHALFSPSGAHKWIRCTGSLAMEKGLPYTTNDSAEEGTAAHELAAVTLTDGAFYTKAYQGRIFNKEWEATEEMCENVQLYVDALRDRIDEFKLAGAVEVHLFVENRIDISEVVGVPDQFGTSDAIFIAVWADGTATLSVEDLKYGYRLVSAKDNEQLMVYGLGAYMLYELSYDIREIRMVIHQPRREHVSDWSVTRDELLAFGETVRAAAQDAQAKMKLPKAQVVPFLTPGEKQCQYCKAAGTCPALGKFVEDTVGAGFADITAELVVSPLQETSSGEDYALKLSKMPLVETWCKALLSSAEAFVFGGGDIPGWKIVAGKKGRRKWGDTSEAEEAMKSMRLRQEEMYNFKLISPTDAEKLLKKDSPRRWNRLKALIVQSEGQPAMVEEDDKRPALQLSAAQEGEFAAVADDV